MTRDDMLNQMAREFTEQGKLIESGWISLQLACIPANASLTQLAEMRMAFFAGAQHLFGSLMSMLDAGVEPTDADLKKMELIDRELRLFLAEFKRKHGLNS